MRLSYSLRPEEYASGVEAVIGSIAATDAHRSWDRRSRRVAIVHYASASLALIASMLMFPQAATALLLFFAVAVVLQEITGHVRQRIAAAGTGATFDRRRHSEVEAVFDGEYVSCAGEEHRQVWRWTLLRRLHDLPGLYVLEFAGFDMLVVPKRAFSTPGQEGGWVSEVGRHVPVPPVHGG